MFGFLSVECFKMSCVLNSVGIGNRSMQIPTEYLICIFDEDGRDYTGQASLNNIKFIIEEHNMKELLNNNYEKLKYEFHNLYKNIYQEKLIIANKQLKIN